MRRQQSGIALITAVLVVALAAIAAAAILTSSNLSIHRTQNLQESELGWWYVDGVESWVKTILQRDAEINQYDSLKDIWAMPAALPVDEGGLRGSVVDLQGRYNVNNLGLGDRNNFNAQSAYFARLYALATGGDESQGKALSEAIRDYVDADSEPTGSGGAEDADYLGFDPPRRVPNRPLQSVSELLTVKGMTPPLYARLAPYLSALPQATTINVNTAAPLVLQALTSQPGRDLEQFIEERVQKPAERRGDFTARVQLGGAVGGGGTPGGSDSSLVDVKSSFFELQVEAYIGTGRLALYSFLYRPGAGTPVVYGRSTFTE
ncbi:MAG: type II secretion system minor pseudopilin GspK [Solimonas sp.]